MRSIHRNNTFIFKQIYIFFSAKNHITQLKKKKGRELSSYSYLDYHTWRPQQLHSLTHSFVFPSLPVWLMPKAAKSVFKRIKCWNLTHLLIAPGQPNNLIEETFLDCIEKRLGYAKDIQMLKVLQDLKIRQAN